MVCSQVIAGFLINSGYQLGRYHYLWTNRRNHFGFQTNCHLLVAITISDQPRFMTCTIINHDEPFENQLSTQVGTLYGERHSLVQFYCEVITIILGSNTLSKNISPAPICNA